LLIVLKPVKIQAILARVLIKMPIIQREALLPYAPEALYDIVNDVEAYPEFLPWCTSSKVLETTETEITAELHLKKGVVSQSFTTKNLLTPKSAMEMTLVDGPFKTLHGLWQFEPMGKGVKVSLVLEFEFASGFLAKCVGPVFEKIAASLVDAFCQRAKDIL
jgi:ribosome-associated toxin RatA of RatAB toxin-antitoxin module